jgi:formylglycine-generating enzyme required for sulfatase activity
MRRVLAILSVLIVLLGSSSALADRNLNLMPKVAPGSVPIAGEYWALIIGIDKYQHPEIPALETAVKDATAVRDMLVSRYGFQADHVQTLLNEQATREAIEDALFRLGKQAGAEDSVFIYYAGHGQIDKESERGFWVPVDGKAQSMGTFVSNSNIRDGIAGMKAKHVYLVADSCFSGTLFGKARVMPPLTEKFFASLYMNKSRWGLTSGMNEPVTDTGKSGHSIFAYFFLKLLRDNENPYLVPSQIYDRIAPLVANNAEQQPRSQPLQMAGDEGGQFVFHLAAGTVTKPKISTPSAQVSEALAPSVALTQAEQELKALEAEEQKVEEQKKLAAVQQQIERKKKQIEEKKNEVIEEARVRPPEAPKDLTREIIGKDGAPMALVPAGDFLYGDNNQRMSLAAFYMDKYEVTTSRYTKFLQETGRKQPEYWNQVSQVSAGDRPVIGVDWYDADAYCHQYGKRLPTEQEWEKAARGTDGRKYPWGNDEPTSRHANFAKPWFSGINYYSDRLQPVGSYEDGKSPYGIYDLVGNVWEWTSSDYDSSNKVRRGGSWLNVVASLRSSNRYWDTPSYGGAITLGFRCAQDSKQMTVPTSEAPKPIEEARVRPLLAPSQTGREIIGKDGAPMVLVPAGEFLYGDNNQRMTLPAFYMDMYELTTARYAKFLQETGREEPKYWKEASPVSDGDRPVIGVTQWQDADAYCRWVDKRLPTEQEWEKAARGTDGRTYPWGNTAPTKNLANYLQGLCLVFCNLYAEKLKPVNSYEGGRSSYGIYNMAGNAWEWVEGGKVLLGGSWLGGEQWLRSTARNRVDLLLALSPSQYGFRCAQDVH